MTHILPGSINRAFSFLSQKTAQPRYKRGWAYLANPVDYDTRDGCTWLGAGMGAMHLFY